jgi:hypothetical protein
VIVCIFNDGHLFIPHVNKENGTCMKSAEVKPVRTRHIQTQVNGMNTWWTWSISIGNNVGKAGKENTFIYTIYKTRPRNDMLRNQRNLNRQKSFWTDRRTILATDPSHVRRKSADPSSDFPPSTRCLHILPKVTNFGLPIPIFVIKIMCKLHRLHICYF